MVKKPKKLNQKNPRDWHKDTAVIELTKDLGSFMFLFLSFLQPQYTTGITVKVPIKTHRTMIKCVPKKLKQNLLGILEKQATVVSFRTISEIVIAQNA